MTKSMSYAEFGQIVTGATGVLLLAFAGYGLANLRFRVPGAGLFVALCLAGALWCFGYAFEKAQTLAEGFEYAARIEYLGVSFLPTLWLLVALCWMEHPLARSRAFQITLMTYSIALVAVVWTNEFHHWWYESVVPTGVPGFARFRPGPAYYLGLGIGASTFVVSTVLLLVRRRATRRFRAKALVILTANIVPLAFALAFQAGLRPGGLDPTIFSLVPVFSVLASGMFRHDFIRIVPIARETVVESLDEPVLVFDPEGRLVDNNKAAAKDLQEILGALAKNPDDRGDLAIPGPNGVRTFRFRRTPIRASGGQPQGSAVILADRTEEKHLLDELAHQASHDALTGVANRRHFEDHALGEITRAGRHGGTLALVLFDLDWFKSINDRFGHPAGDRVLRQVVAVVRPRLRTYDQLARIGGEEFAVLMPEAGPDEAREAAERWRAALEAAPPVLPGTDSAVTASFGVATLDDIPFTLSPDPRTRLDALLGHADKALYQAKAEGRNRVC